MDDSDDEEPAKDARLESIPLRMHSIVVTDIAYTTYAAILVYLQSGHITFAPLLSTFRSKPSELPPAERRRVAVKELAARTPLLPLPVSSKAVYRAAHRLELPQTLVDLALSHFKSQLTPRNVGYELFSATAACYSEIKTACLDYAVQHWAEVGSSEGIKEIEALDDAELPRGAFGTVMEVTRRLARPEPAIGNVD